MSEKGHINPRGGIIGGLIGKLNDILNEIAPRAEVLEISQFEVNLAGVCAGIVCGAVPGIVAGRLKLPVWVVPPLSYASSWWVCENLFPIAHAYYGSGSIWHRVYDVGGVGSGLLMYYLVKR